METAAKNAFELNSWDAIWSASPIVQLTLLALIAMSIVCWAVIFSKMNIFRRLRESNHLFLEEFWKADSLDAINKRCEAYQDSSVARTFKAGYIELQRMAESSIEEEDPEHHGDAVPRLTGSDNIQRALHRALDSEINQLENRLSLLATTGSTAPFIGLFGTVWGIMGSFQKIGAMKSASLAVVAPGISEALIATAIGLATAIPAVMAYNHFITKLKKEEILLSNFSSDYLNIVKRNFFKEK